MYYTCVFVNEATLKQVLVVGAYSIWPLTSRRQSTMARPHRRASGNRSPIRPL